MPIERKLAAIVFTDIAGYTAQMSKDQDIAFDLLETKKKVFQPLLKKYNGKLVKEMGDGTLSHFPSAVDASNCSIELQKKIINNDNLNIRIGIHLGDTMFKDNDVFGDGVNIASRLETMSPPGGILVSKNVYDELQSRKGFEGVSLGLQKLKNAGRLIEVFSLKKDFLNVANPEDYISTRVDKHEDKELPSVAVIPLINKGAQKNIFYAYGISTSLTSDLSGSSDIRVASLKDIDRLDTSLLTNSELAKKLMVRYIVSGMLWKEGKIFQLSIELFDSKHQRILWSDRWQEDWDNLTKIKAKLGDGVLKTLNAKTDKKLLDDTENPVAYEFYLKGKYRHEKRNSTEDIEIARGFFQKAVELDLNFIHAEIELGLTYFFTGNYSKAQKIFSISLEKSEKNNNQKAIARCFNNLGMIFKNQHNYKKAIEYYKNSLIVGEKLGDKLSVAKSLNNLGMVEFYQIRFNKAIKYFRRSLKIKEDLEDQRGIAATLNNCALVYKNQGDYLLAFESMEKSLKIYIDIGAQKEISDIYYNMGNNLMQYQQDYNQAMSYFQKSLAIKDKLNEKIGIAHCLYTISELSFLNDNTNFSFLDLDRCIELRRKLKYNDGILEALVLYSIILQSKGEGIIQKRKEIKKLINKSENISYITYFRLHKIFSDYKDLSAEYLNKSRELVLSTAENYPTGKARKDFFQMFPINEILHKNN